MKSFKVKCFGLADEAGSGLIETCFSMVILLTMIFSILDMSRAVFVDHYVAYSAREAARYAMVRGSTWKNASCGTTTTSSCTATSQDVSNYVKSITPMGTSAGQDLTVSTTWSGTTPAGGNCAASQGTNSPGCLVTVQVSDNFNFVLPFLPKGTLVLTSSSSMGIAQ